MKAFHFPLQKVLEWRSTEREMESAKMRRLAEELQRLADEISAVEAEIRAVRKRVLESAGPGSPRLESWDLSPIPAFEERLKKAAAVLQTRKVALTLEVGEQRQKLLEAQRRVDLMQKLREKRFAAWTAAHNLENEQFAAEAFLGRWAAERTNGARRERQNL